MASDYRSADVVVVASVVGVADIAVGAAGAVDVALVASVVAFLRVAGRY